MIARHGAALVELGLGRIDRGTGLAGGRPLLIVALRLGSLVVAPGARKLERHSAHAGLGGDDPLLLG
jgi:hypothetical protein